MNDWEWQARRDRTERYLDKKYDRQRSDRLTDNRRNWELKSEQQTELERIRGRSAFEIEAMRAEDRIAVMGREYELGELVRNNNLRRRCVEAAIEMRLLSHETDEQIRLEDNRHANAKDFKSHETDEIIRLKKAFGQMTSEERAAFFAEFEAEERAKKGN